jgi:hypothetical protein
VGRSGSTGNRSDILARASRPFEPSAQWRAMLQRLLADRVRLAIRREARPTPVFAPSVFTAVQEQLGLRLEPRRGSLDVILIDHVERPLPD